MIDEKIRNSQTVMLNLIHIPAERNTECNSGLLILLPHALLVKGEKIRQPKTSFPPLSYLSLDEQNPLSGPDLDAGFRVDSSLSFLFFHRFHP